MNLSNPNSNQISSYFICWHTEEDTKFFCKKLGNLLLHNPIFRNLYIELNGDLGAGKTTFTRYLLRQLGVTGRIKSPTYAILENYCIEQENFNIWHFDCYRLAEPQEWEEAGFRDIFDQYGLKLVEWAQQAKGQLPTADLKLNIQIDQQQRLVDISAGSNLGKTILLKLL